MDERKLIAYVLIVLLVSVVTAWAWTRQRREALEKQRRHGPRED